LAFSLVIELQAIRAQLHAWHKILSMQPCNRTITKCLYQVFCYKSIQCLLVVSRKPGLSPRPNQDLLGNIVVVEITHNAEAREAVMIHYAGDLPSAMNSHFISQLIRRRDKNFDPYLRACWRSPLAANERSIERDVGRKASLGMLATVIPVEDYRKAQLVSDSSPSLRTELRDSWRTQVHRNRSLPVLTATHKPPNV
jgi:hypothetical protein